jgi:hypothetical protein
MISPHLNMALAEAKVDDLRRAADAHRVADARAEPGQPVALERSVTLRFGSAADERRLARLAALDSSAPPARPVLLAEVDGRLRAALGLSDGTIVADPFHRTADLIDLLRARARHFHGDRQTRRADSLPSWSRVRALVWR